MYLSRNDILCADQLDNYIVLDLETTGFSPENDDIIEIAMIKFENGKFDSCFESLLNPCCHIPSRISEITGIYDKDLLNAPSLRNVISDIDRFIGDHIVVGHNIGFDISFLQKAYRDLLNEDKSFRCIDTLSLSRYVFPEFNSHKLEHLSLELGIVAEKFHRAMNDVLCTNHLLHNCVSRLDISLNNLLDIFHHSPKKKIRKYEKVTPTMMKPKCNEFDCNHTLYDKTLVFTGTCTNSRDCLIQFALDVGALVKTSVSSKTHYLVVGKQDVALVGEDGMSSKEEKAYALNESGRGNIRIISEKEFLHLIEGGAKREQSDIILV